MLQYTIIGLESGGLISTCTCFYAVLWGRKRRREEGRRGLEGRGGEGKRDMTG